MEEPLNEQGPAERTQGRRRQNHERVMVEPGDEHSPAVTPLASESEWDSGKDAEPAFGCASSARWRRLCSAAAAPGTLLLHLPPLLHEVMYELPARYSRYAWQLVTGQSEADMNIDLSRPPAQRRHRNLLPLPLINVDNHELPHQVSHTEGLPTRIASRRGWLLLLIATLNFLWHRGSQSAAEAPLHGPASPAQYAAIIRLGAAADTMCCLSPHQLEEHDWRVELGKTGVSYEGEEVSTAQPLAHCRVAPTLPPVGVAGSVPIVELLEGRVKEVVENCSLARLPTEEVDESWPTPRIMMERTESKVELLVHLWEIGLVAVVEQERIWTHRGRMVLNGLFGVEKATKWEKQVWHAGEWRNLQRLIMNLVPSNSLQLRIDADVDALPHAGQWGCVHLLPYELFIGS